MKNQRREGLLAGMAIGATCFRTACVVMAATLVACDNPSAPFVANNTGGKAIALTPVTPVSSTDVVGNSPNQSPAVVALDSNGDAVAGITVQFTIAEGGGQVHYGGKPVDGLVHTNESGIAVMPGWRLGTQPGVNKAVASSGKLTPVEFTVVTAPGPGRVLTIVRGSDEIAPPHTTLAIPPAVKISDHYGNPIGGEVVSFAVSGGGGTISSGSVVSGADGIAGVASWSVGGIGRQEVTATHSAVPKPALFTALAAEAVDPSCPSYRTIASAVEARELGLESCRTTSGRPFDLHHAVVRADGVYRFTAGSTAFDAHMEMFDSTGARLAQNDNSSRTTTDAGIEAHLVKGRYILAVSSVSAIAAGPYAISLDTAVVTGCDIPAVVPDVVIRSQIKGCPEAPWGYSSDRYRIHLREGQTLSLRLEFSDGLMEPTLMVTNSSGTVFAGITNTQYVAKDISLIYAAPADEYYFVVVAGLPGGFDYTLMVK